MVEYGSVCCEGCETELIAAHAMASGRAGLGQLYGSVPQFPPCRRCLNRLSYLRCECQRKQRIGQHRISIIR